MELIGIRGAVRAERNDREAIVAATRGLLLEIERRNGLHRATVVSAFFTMTPDLDAAFPASAARELGWGDVPMLGAQETAVPGSPERTIRVLLHARAAGPARHVYLGEAAALRPDLADPRGEAEEAPAASGAAPSPEPLGTLLVVGLGLIGGSIALAVRGRGGFRRVLGADRDAAAVELALRRRAIDAGATDAARLLPEADVVLLALPVLAAAAWVREHGRRLAPGRTLVDVCGTKRVVLGEMERLPAGVEAIGAHPMGGSEAGGMAAARADLLRGAPWALVPAGRTGARAARAARALVEATGGVAVAVDAERHDAAIAAVSHLPYLLAAALALHVGEGRDAALRKDLAGPGLLGVTRLAASPPAVVSEVLRTNWENVRAEARVWVQGFERLLAELERQLPGDLSPVLERARARAVLLASPPAG